MWSNVVYVERSIMLETNLTLIITMSVVWMSVSNILYRVVAQILAVN